MVTKLSPQREVFAAELAKGKTQADAHRIAFPKSKSWKDSALYAEASRIASDPKVVARLAELTASGMRKLEITVERVLQERARLAFFDPRKLLDATGRPLSLQELDDDTAACIAGMKVQDKFERAPDGGQGAASTVLEYKLADKNASLTALERHLGMYQVEDGGRKAGVINIQINLGG